MKAAFALLLTLFASISTRGELWRRLNLDRRVLVLGLLLGFAGPCFGTEQEDDLIKWSGSSGILSELPLNDYLQTLTPIPKFDPQRTSNWKGYDADWEIRDGHLYLVTFTAKSNQRDVPITALFPGRELPIRADWFSGTLHIGAGKRLGNRGSYYYERSFECLVTKGVVTEMKETKSAPKGESKPPR